jgi:hypothetical protein
VAAKAAGASPLISGLLNSPAIGKVVSGLGSGVSAKAQVEAEAEARATEIARINSNYSLKGGLLDPATQQPAGPTTPAAMGPGSQEFANIGQWVYDPRVGKLVRKNQVAA